MKSIINQTMAIGDSYKLSYAKRGNLVFIKSTREIISKNSNFFSCDSYKHIKTINKKHKEWSLKMINRRNQ